MKRRTVLILVVLITFVGGGAFAYEAWQDRKRAQAFDELVNNLSDCDCAARHKNASHRKIQRDQELVARELSGSSASDSQ